MINRIATLVAAVLATIQLYGQQAQMFQTPADYKAGVTEVTIDAGKELAEIAPTMYGVFFEDINRSADGGMYAELIFNRGFEENNLPSTFTYRDGRAWAVPGHIYSNPSEERQWSIPWDIDNTHPGWTIEDNGCEYTLSVEDTDHLGVRDSKVMKINIAKIGKPLKVVNSGFFGLHVKAGDKYNAKMYVKASKGYKGSIVAQIRNSEGRVLASKKFALNGNGKWNCFKGALVPDETVSDGTFALVLDSEGEVELDYISLFPEKTFMNRPEGLRQDVAQFVADLKPAFMRWPGGCIVEGCTMENRVDWKSTLGAPELRHGEYNLWGYHSTWGFGYHEFLQYCEDINCKTMFVCNAGMSCDARNGDYYDDDKVAGLIQDALDAIEYATGDAKTTKWGAERAKNGHPEPFGLDYIEVGNENHSARYAENYNRFYKAIREAYPDITILTCLPMSDQLGWIDGYDLNDPHFYNFPNWFFSNTDYFDNFEREEGHKVYVGEYACNMGVGHGTMEAALSEGAFLTGMERNSDLVVMSSYAPLMENTKNTICVNLILVQNDGVIGRSSYWVERIFTDNRPDVNLDTKVDFDILPDKTTPVGGIGLGCYETAVEYSNIKAYADGELIYESDLESRPEEWESQRGNWEIKDGKIIQSENMGCGAIMLKGLNIDARKHDIVTVEFDARKLGGREGFVLHFGSRDSRNCYQMTLGSFGNNWTIFQRCYNGACDVMNNERPTTPIHEGHTYHVKCVIRNQNNFECWIDGKKDLTYDNTYCQRQYVISGLDRANNEIIIKAINGENADMPLRLNLLNAKASDKASVSTVWAESIYDENSFEEPDKIKRETSVVNLADTDNVITIKSNSANAIRIKIDR